MPSALDERGEDPAEDPGDAQLAADADLDASVEPGEDAAAIDAGGPPTADAAPGFDAADTSLDATLAADTSTAIDTSIADTSIADTSIAADTSTATDASTAPADAAPDASEAGQPPSGMRIVVDNRAGTATLSDFPVLVRVDTQALVRQGLLAADCSNLRIYGGSGCSAARSYFLPAHACNVASGELWLRVPQVSAGTREVFELRFGSAGEASSGSRAFPFFEGFDGSSLDSGRWIARGTGSVSVSGGVLQSQGVVQLESLTRTVSAGQSIVGARLAALSAYDTDVELGAGVVSANDPIWAPGRSWDGVTLVSHDFATYAFDGPAGSACDDLANSSPTPQIGAAWLDRPPATAGFLTAEFGYSVVSGRAQAWLRTSRGASLSYTAPSGCGLPATLPVLITLDHNAPDAPIQRVDYVYVRRAAATEPTTSVLSASTLACGPAP